MATSEPVDVEAVDAEAPLSFGGLRGFSVFNRCAGKLKIVGTASTENKNRLILLANE